ncbi:MAG: TolC family outer membrane protein [Pseudomonadales bacterium]|nr:TolC family outer membrane protein [Pseudomonadales bacterium]
MDKICFRHFSALIIICTTFTFSQTGHAENLIETYQLAIKNDPSWAAKKAKFLAEREGVNQAFGGLLPQANLAITYGQQEYEGSTLDVEETFNDSDIEGCQRFSDALNDLGSGEDLSNIPASAAFGLGGCTNLLSSLAEINTTTSSQSYTAEQYSLSVSQPLFRMDRWYRYKQAQRLENSAQANLAFEQQDLVVRVAEAYFGVLKAQEELRIAKAEEKSLKTQLIEIKNRYKLGLLRDTELFEVQATYDLARAIRLKAEGEVDNIKETLRILTGQQTVLVNPLPDDIPVEAPKPLDIEEWVEFAKQNNYRVVAAQFAVDGAAAKKQEKRAGHMPTADLYFDYSDRDVGGGFTPSSKTQTIGLKINVPLFSGGITSSQEKQSRYQHEEAKNNLILARRSAIMETRQYHRRVATDVSTVKANLRAVKSNNSAYKSIKNGYESGLRLLTDLLSSQSRVYKARKELTTSRYDYILNTLRLKRAAGILSPKDLEVLNSWLDNPTVTSVSSSDYDSSMDLEEIDGIKFNQERQIVPMKPEQQEKKPGHKSLYDAFKAWRSDGEKEE